MSKKCYNHILLIPFRLDIGPEAGRKGARPCGTCAESKAGWSRTASEVEPMAPRKGETITKTRK